jgi:hypothetical protein
MTRFLLLALGVVSWAALVASHDQAGVWLAFVSLVQAIVLWLLSLQRGIGGRDPLDWWCLVLCAIGIILWLLSRESMFGLCMSIVADTVACIPSLRKAWRLPHTESATFYWLDVFASICIVAAAPLRWQAQLYPVYLAAVNTVFGLAIWHGSWQLRKITPTDRSASDIIEL